MPLISYLKRVNSRIKSNGRYRIEKEGDLERVVKTGHRSNLLPLLGYVGADVEDHLVKITYIGRSLYAPDYLLRRQNKYAVVVDLKSPGENLGGWHGQLLSYCREVQAPLGLLYNGIEVQLFINTSHDRLSQFHKDFHLMPVAAADIEDVQRMAQIFNYVSKSRLANGDFRMARELARKRIVEIKRQQKIRERLQAIKSNPSDNVLTAIREADTRIRNMTPRPTLRELRAGW